MTSVTSDPRRPGVSTGEFLYRTGLGVETVQSMGQSLHDIGAAAAALRGVRRLSGSALRLVDDEIASVAVSQLDHDLGSMLEKGWGDYGRLQEAARASLETPGVATEVELLTQTVTATRHPRADVLLDGTVVYQFTFDLVARFTLTSLAAEVRDGCLVGVRSGRCTVNVALVLEKGPMHPERAITSHTEEVDLSVLLPLDQPIPLVDEARRRLR